MSKKKTGADAFEKTGKLGILGERGNVGECGTWKGAESKKESDTDNNGANDSQ